MSDPDTHSGVAPNHQIGRRDVGRLKRQDALARQHTAMTTCSSVIASPQARGIAVARTITIFEDQQGGRARGDWPEGVCMSVVDGKASQSKGSPQPEDAARRRRSTHSSFLHDTESQ